MNLSVLLGGKATKKRPRRRMDDSPPKPRKQIPLPDGKDVFLFGGLGVAGYGLWEIYPPSALILVGGVFFAIGVFWYIGNGK